MSCIISDRVVTFDKTDTPIPVVGRSVHFSWSSTPVFRKVGGVWVPEQNPPPLAGTDSTGTWTITVPWPSETKPLSPNTPTLTITYPDGGPAWAGIVPEGIAGPLSIDTLLNTYGWGLVKGTTTQVVTVQGPTGPTGPQGPQGPAGSGGTTDATTSIVGGGLIDVAPTSGHPILATLVVSRLRSWLNL